MTQTYDAIIIGGGHNGLVTAAYLAQAGRKVLVLERRPVVGGAAVTEEYAGAPGFKFSACAGGAGNLLPQVVRDLGLHAHGLEIVRPADAPAVFAPQPDGRALTLWPDTARSAREIEAFSKNDAARYPEFVEMLDKVSALVRGLMTAVPPALPEIGRGDWMELLRLFGPARRLGKKHLHNTLRLLPMPVADLLDEWFEADALRGIVAARGVTGINWGPRAAGTAYTLLYAWAAGGGGLGGGGTVRGGMGALTQAIAAAAQGFGAEIRTGAEVAHILVPNGHAAGVALASGEEISAGAVISNADPRTTFFRLLDPGRLDPDFVWGARNIKYRGCGARVHLALDELPQFTALGGADADPAGLRGQILIAPGVDYLERAYDEGKYGGFSHSPMLDVSIPSLNDPGLAPPGKHTLSVYMQYAPYQLRGTDWEAQREALGDVVVDTLAQYAPNLKSAIRFRKVLTPLDLESIYGLPEGNPNHGEMTLDQFLHMRPVGGWAQYRTPVPGLYLCGAGTHPGGGVTGANGYNAARVVMRNA